MAITPTNHVTPFQERVYALLQQIPPGRISSYAALAAALHSSPRAVGGALKRNPFAPEIPCHRVIGSSGFIGGFQGEWRRGVVRGSGSWERKRALLEGEGVRFDERGRLVDRGRWWREFRVKG